MKKSIVGNQGDKIRSDCYVELEITESGGIQLELQSKVSVLFGKSIKKLVFEMMEFYEVVNASIYLKDTGALPLVIAARIEAAIHQSGLSSKEFLLPILDNNTADTLANQMRFSRLYLPGNSPSMMLNAGIHHPNGIILDLEDAVAHDKKFEARFMVRNALRGINFYGAERMVRINQVPAGLDDLEFIVPHHVNLILVPKCETAEQVHRVNDRIDAIKAKHGITYPIWLMPIIESALGVVNAYSIASSATNVVSLAIGLEDYTADLGTLRTAEGEESFYARAAVVNACRAAGKQPIDSVFSDVSDMDALALNVQKSKALGFDGMGCIHPRQIAVIHDNFAPTNAEIEKAKQICLAFTHAKKNGLGVVSLGTKMIDAPVVKRAQNSLNTAIKLGIVSADWESEIEA